MANTISGLFETRVIPAGIAAAQALQYTKASLRAIYWDYKAEGGEIGQTMNVNIPVVNSGDSSDIGSGSLNPSDTEHTTVPIVLAHHASASFIIKSWDKIRTPVMLQELYLQPKLEALLRQCNGYVTGLFNATTFNYYTVYTGGSSTFTRINLTTAWANLAGQGAPVYQPDSLAFVTHPACYAGMLADTSFFQAYVVGEGAAVQALQRGALVPTLNAKVLFDQQMPLNASSKNQGIFLHRYAIAGVCAPPPSNEELGQVEEAVIYPVAEAPNFAVQIQMAYSIKDQGTIVNLHTNVGFACTRPDFGSIGAAT